MNYLDILQINTKNLQVFACPASYRHLGTTKQSGASTMSDENKIATRWDIVWLMFGAGVVAAAHIGKLPPALPAIQDEMAVGLVMAGWIASMISTIGFALGLVAGTLADKIGARRVLFLGLVSLAFGSLLGGLADSAGMILAARFIEGIGFTSTTIAGGVIVAKATIDQDRKWALGVFAAYMPTGFAGMMIFSAVILDTFGWRVLWFISTGITVIWILVLWNPIAVWQQAQIHVANQQSIIANVRRTLRVTGGVLVAACFAVYATQHISMMNWLPTYMIEVYASGTLIAAGIPALVLIFNGCGNYLAAWAMGRGIPIWLLLALGASGMALAELGIFSEAVPDAVRLALALGFGVAGGLIPASALAAAPVYAPTPILIGSLSGIMVMGSNTGQLFGPPALAAAREASGNWSGTLWLLLGLAVIGVVLALASRPMEQRAAAGLGR